MLYPNELVITDTNYLQHAEARVDDALGRRAKGLVPRNYSTYPQGFYSGEVGMDAVPDLVSFDPADFPKIIKELEDSKTRLSDFRMTRGPGGGMIPSLDQNGRGYCWRHSPTSAHLLVRARDEMPYLDLSPYAGACRIKNYRDEGGWGAQGLDDVIQFGDPTSQFWPQRATSRQYDTAETWANAKLHRFTEGWIDLSAAQYDRNLAFNQMITSLLCRVPVIIDLNWWSHSICGCDAVNGATQWKVTRAESGKLMAKTEFDAFWGMNDPVTGGICPRIWNSWGDSYGVNGMAVLAGSKGIPDGATAPRVATWADK